MVAESRRVPEYALLKPTYLGPAWRVMDETDTGGAGEGAGAGGGAVTSLTEKVILFSCKSYNRLYRQLQLCFWTGAGRKLYPLYRLSRLQPLFPCRNEYYFFSKRSNCTSPCTCPFSSSPCICFIHYSPGWAQVCGLEQGIFRNSSAFRNHKPCGPGGECCDIQLSFIQSRQPCTRSHIAHRLKWQRKDRISIACIQHQAARQLQLLCYCTERKEQRRICQRRFRLRCFIP